MYCKNCGKQLPDGAQFCDGCGARQVDGGYSAQQVKSGYVAYTNGREPKPSVGFIDAIKMFFTKYADFNTRSRRSEYWWAALFCALAGMVASAILMPEGKEAVIRQLQKYGKVAMVGDGINDAPALTRADTGIAIGAGTDVAIDAADVVLMNSKLSDVPAAIRLSRASLRNIHENLFWAFIYNIIGIPLAAGVFIPLGLTLNPMFGAAAMSLSSFCVVSNALRLNLFDLHSAKRDHPPKHVPALPAVLVQPAAEEDTTQKEETAMKKTLTVEGMMCPHCEARVKKALEALPQVDEAVVSHEAGTAIVTLNAEVDDEVLKKAVEAQDYPVTSIQ